MENIFVSKIKVDKVRSLRNLEIQLSESERKHLILTGKNGSGKTSLLNAMTIKIFQMAQEEVFGKYGTKSDNVSKILKLCSSAVRHQIEYFYKQTPQEFDIDASIELYFNSLKIPLYETICVYIPAKRQLRLDKPKSIEKVELVGQTAITNNLSEDFLKYILYLHYQLLFAQNSNDTRRAAMLKEWLTNLENALAEIYKCRELKLRPDTENLTFQIEIPGHEPFGFNQMADGYSALLNIVTEMLMRMDNGKGLVEYEKSGIVLVDEIETHLHVELQKRILPFLTKMFPNMQFIVSTHSPFIISSLENAFVFDLEKKESLENPQRYSYETIIESYLDTDMYSVQIKEQLETYKSLYDKERTPEENKKFLRAKTELELVPPVSREVYFAFRQLEEKRKGNKK